MEPNCYFSRHLEHNKLIAKRIEDSLRAEKAPKPKRPKPETPYKGSWADEMEQRRNGTWNGPPLVKPEPYDKHWVSIGRCDYKGNLFPNPTKQ